MVRTVDGLGFAFVPRSLVAQPAAFGRVPGLLEPADGVEPGSERYRAAMIQHLFCVTARTEVLRKAGVSPVQYVAREMSTGFGEDRVRRIFRGVTMAQLTDFALWAGRFPEIAAVIETYMASWSAASQEQVHPRTAAVSSDASEARR